MLENTQINNLEPKLEKLLASEEIRMRVKQLGQQITRDYEGKSLVLVSILRGSVVFLADLMRRIKLPLEIAFIGAKSYRNSTQPDSIPHISLPDNIEVKNKNVLFVEDIFDTGNTLKAVKKEFIKFGAREVKICVLLQKTNDKQAKDLPPDYVGFIIGNEFVVGYGLDYQEKYRNLPGIYVLKE